MTGDRATIPITPIAGEIPVLRLPDAGTLFADRARRMASLASGHAMADYLRFMADLAMAQQHALSALGQPALPAVTAGNLPPLAAARLARAPAWQQALHHIVHEISPGAPAAFSDRLNAQLAPASGTELDRWAAAWLQGNFTGLDVGLLSVVGAALQVYWTAMSRQLDGGAISRAAPLTSLCPVCGSLPVGSLVHSGTDRHGLRYLCCSLCATEWNLGRIRCVSCGDSAHIAYYGIENGGGAVQAEACDACHTYSKLVHMEKSPAADIVADDLASMALDLLMAEAGYRRYGFNPFLLTEES